MHCMTYERRGAHGIRSAQVIRGCAHCRPSHISLAAGPMKTDCRRRSLMVAAHMRLSRQEIGSAVSAK